MSSFFRQIIDLGDEGANRPSTTMSPEDLDRMTRDELRAELRSVCGRLEERDGEVAQLREDAGSLQSRFDAFKKKVDGWQLQMRELRAADKKALEEFRAASAVGGEVGAAYLNTLEEKVAALKQSVAEAQEASAIAFRRQRDAEQARAALEASAKRDYDELFARFSTFKEKTKVMQGRYEAQIQALAGELAAAGHQLSPHDDEPAGSSSGPTAGTTPFRPASPPPLPSTPRGVLPTQPAEGDDGITTATAHSSPTQPIPIPGGLAESTAVDATLPGAVEVEASLRAQVSAARAAETAALSKLHALEGEVRGLREELEWSSVESEKRLSELRGQVDSWRARHGEVSSQLEEAEVRLALLKREAERSANDGEHSRHLEVSKHVRLLEIEKERTAALQEEVAEIRAKLSMHDSRAASANESAESATKEIRAMQAAHTQALLERDERAKQLLMIVDIKEAAASEARQETDRAVAELETLRAELHSKEALVRACELEQAGAQRALAAREDDLHGRERERQALRGQLQDEQDRSADLRAQLRECEVRAAELEAECRRRESARGVAVEEGMRLSAANGALEETIAVLEKRLGVKDLQLADLGKEIQALTQQMQDGGGVVGIAEGGRGGASSAAADFERQVARLERELRLSRDETAKVRRALEATSVVERASEGGDDNSSSGAAAGGKSDGGFLLGLLEAGGRIPSGGGIGASSSAGRHRLDSLNDVFTSARRTVVVRDVLSQMTWKTVVLGVVILLTLTSMWSGTKVVGGVHGARDAETAEILHEKYSQAATALQACQTTLRGVLSAPAAAAAAEIRAIRGPAVTR